MFQMPCVPLPLHLLEHIGSFGPDLIIGLYPHLRMPRWITPGFIGAIIERDPALQPDLPRIFGTALQKYMDQDLTDKSQYAYFLAEILRHKRWTLLDIFRIYFPYQSARTSFKLGLVLDCLADRQSDLETEEIIVYLFPFVDDPATFVTEAIRRKLACLESIFHALGQSPTKFSADTEEGIYDLLLQKRVDNQLVELFYAQSDLPLSPADVRRDCLYASSH